MKKCQVGGRYFLISKFDVDTRIYTTGEFPGLGTGLSRSVVEGLCISHDMTVGTPMAM